MARIKIKELPSILLKDVTDLDIMVVENKQDTFQISVADLKVLFSCDNKIEALNILLTKMIEELENEMNETDSELSKDIITLQNELNTFKNTIDSFSKKIANVEKTIVDHELRIIEVETELDRSVDRLDTMDTLHTKQETRLKSLESDNITNKENLTQLNETTAEHSTKLIDIGVALDNHKKEIDQNKLAIEAIVNKNYSDLDTKIDSKYQELLDIIDFYHHTTHE